MTAQTYLFFDGRCEEAVRLYQEAFGAEIRYLMRFGEAPGGGGPAGYEEKIFHGTIAIGDTEVRVADDPESKPFGGFALLVMMEDQAQARRAFDLLKEGGEVVVPLAEAFWAALYGRVTDRFGMSWKLQVN